MKLILPKRYVNIQNNPSLFLAGPMLGAEDWRIKALEQIQNNYHLESENLYVFSPQLHLPQKFLVNSLGEVKPNSYQLGWEREYLREIAKRRDKPKGLTMFWLEGVDEKSLSKELLSRYARNTRRELGVLDGWLDYNKNINFVIGGEDSFPEFDTVKRCFLEHFPNMEFPKTLEETVKKSLEILF